MMTSFIQASIGKMDVGAEERQQLLSEEGRRESEDERPPVPLPPQLPPQPTPLQSVPLHPLPPLSTLPPLPPPPLPGMHEAPPAYNTDLPAYSDVKPVGIPVQLQVDGRTVSATLIQEPHGQHMVYISNDTNQGQKPPPPKDFLILSLLGLVCCCFPLGVFALIRSLEVHRLYQQGDYNGAMKASRQAQSWGMAAVIFGLCIFVLPVIMRLYFLHSHHTHYQHPYYDDYTN